MNLIKDRDLYGKETPSQIYESCSSSFDSSVFNKWMYFFTKIKKKFSGNPSAKRIDRIVGNGSWKSSNTTKVYYENNKNLVIGYRTLLNFIVKSPENKTNEEKKQTNSWILYEYTLKGNDALDNDSIWAVCKFRKGGKLRKDSHDNPPPSKRERPPSVVVAEDDDGDVCYEPEKKRACYRSSSSAFMKNKYDEGLVVQGQQQCVTDQYNVDDWLCVPTKDECETETAFLSSSYPLSSETDQQQYTSDNTFDEYLFCNPSGDDCNTTSTSYQLSPLTTLDDLPSFYDYNSQQPHQIGADSNATTSSCWNECGTTCASKGAPTPTGISMPAVDSNDDQPQPGYNTVVVAQPGDQCAYRNDAEEIRKSVSTDPLDDCNTASTSYPLSPLTTLDDLPSFYLFNSEQPHQMGAGINAITSLCWNDCETTSTSCVSKGAPTQTLTGVSIPNDSSNAAQLDDQCAYSTVNEEKIWSPEDWKELELMLLSGIESF
ncbi:hypothetical protein FRX31_010871 [Thalictrum thalictroides]|uniref:NAC domain-containing protein n=1 Tax=Thalictrum thalictroides TaxID=46969 RepID=A0A7J6WU30_THATH|nr:hypothetical protein FRX31_010871 [Thalictrum thalictroides]